LREHFHDPLLIRKNGKMTLSARAHTLLPLLEVSLLGLNNLLAPEEFDPSTAKRRFRIAMSDYAARIVATTGCTSSRKGAGLDLAINQASRDMMQAQLEEGEVDLALGVFPRAGEELRDTFSRDVYLSCRQTLSARERKADARYVAGKTPCAAWGET
jgi:DNA-binding transcriptional LysR family regulator